MIAFIYDVFQIFMGFILGIYFERWNESRNEKKWVKKAMMSILYDLKLDHKIFKDVVDLDSQRLKEDKKLVSEIDNTMNSIDIFVNLDKIFKNSEESKIWSNVPNYEVNYIDLNRSNYVSFIKNASRDDLLDNTLKANLDWIFEGLWKLYWKNFEQILQAEYDLKKKLTTIGYPYTELNKSENNISEKDKKSIVAFFQIYFDKREKDILIKKSLLKGLISNQKRIIKNLKEPIISDVYKMDYNWEEELNKLQ
tara:strand:- start:94 stop:849 length:756 start_codon:yes stop_codon:yes gene_type:complete